jgi:ferrous iron transport protein B
LTNEEIIQASEKSLTHLKSIYGDEAETVIADGRYGFISGLLKDVLEKPTIDRVSVSDKIDRVIVNRWLGLPIFLGIMYLAFQFVFTLSVPFMDWIDAGFGWLGEEAATIGGWGGSLLADGVVGGVGSVIIFVPPIFLLFIAISLLEDCGYMARAAFVMDRIMHKIGLHGRSFIPMILGFGCNIPGIMACRTIENRKDRLTTILINPFMSCGARLPIFVLLAGYFFAAHAGLVVFALYIIGVVVAIIMASVFRKTLFRGQESGHFVMELPPYRAPTPKAVLIHMWERGSVFLRKAGTIIFGVVVLIWLLDYTGALEPIGRALAPILTPCGFGQWQVAVALLFGLLAKEVVVGTMGVLFAAEEGALGAAIVAQLGWTPLIAFGFMTFCLLYVPCVAALGAIRAETNSTWKWPLFTLAYTTAIAWIGATLIFQIGSLFTG